MKIRNAILEFLFDLYMLFLLEDRVAGRFGTSDKPIVIRKGEQLPHWLICRYPFRMIFRAEQDLQTFFDGGKQHLYPLEDLPDQSYIYADSKGVDILGNAGGLVVHDLPIGGIPAISIDSNSTDTIIIPAFLHAKD